MDQVVFPYPLNFGSSDAATQVYLETEDNESREVYRRQVVQSGPKCRL